jgi:hypothetical protein
MLYYKNAKKIRYSQTIKVISQPDNQKDNSVHPLRVSICKVGSQKGIKYHRNLTGVRSLILRYVAASRLIASKKPEYLYHNKKSPAQTQGSHNYQKKEVELVFDFNQLETALANKFWLKISPAEQKKAWKQAENHSNKIARYNAYLNNVCLQTFFKWLKDWLAEESMPKSILPNEDSLASIWEVVNGAAIKLGERRIVLITSETEDLELCVPQEWIDIPNWVGDYYLAVQVNLEANEDECFLRVCGFTTHRQIKYEGKYNASDRTYVLPAENLTKNLTVMQVTMGLDMREKIPELPTLSEDEAQKLLEILGDSSIYFPRLRVDVPFEKWAALLNNDELRQQLYQRRIGRVDIKSATKANNLSQWFQNIFDDGWESLNTILNTANTAFCFRQRDVDVREVSVEGIKLIDMGMQLGNKSVALLVGLTQEPEQKVSIRVQLHPARGQTYLPPNIKLALISASGASLQEFESRIQDNFIQLKRFSCPTGKSFKIKVTIDNFSIIEDFVISPLLINRHE